MVHIGASSEPPVSIVGCWARERAERHVLRQC